MRACDEKPAGVLRLRPRHILCLNGFESAKGLDHHGHGEAMTANMSRIARDQLRVPGGEDVRIIVADSADSICAPCAFRESRNCRMLERAQQTDGRHAEALGIAPGQVLRWGDLIMRIRMRVRPGDLDRMCRGCPWLPVGMCKAAVARLRAGPPSPVEAPTD